MSTIFGKDRATGRDAQSHTDIIEDMAEQVSVEGNRNGAFEDQDETDLGFDMDIPLGNTSPLEENPSDTTLGSRKRRRNSSDQADMLLKGMEKIAHTLAEGFKEATENLGMHIDRVDREKRIDGMKENLFEELMKLTDLSNEDRLVAYVKMIADESMLIGFYAMPANGKVAVIRKLIG